MLTIHFANRHETLEALLLDALDAGAAGRSPFDADEVIVPSAALRRRLTLAIAQHQGVCAQVRFPYLAQWLWQQAATVRSAVSGTLARARPPLQAEPLAWRIVAALSDERWLAAQPRLQAYLARVDAVTRLDLAQRLAALFDQYATYRPEWLAAWSAGRRVVPDSPDEAWQAALWCRLAGELSPAPDVDSLVHPLGPVLPPGATLPPGTGLPASAHVFALPTIAPVHLALLQQLGRWMDLQVYALNPCRQYWFEVVDRRRLARLAAQGRAEHHEEGNRLLAAWGRQAQAQLAALVETCGDAVIDDDHYTPDPAPTRLAALHNAILDLTELAPASVPLPDDDRSLEVHVCHSMTRQLEVLHDTLLALRAAPGAPAPGEILVVLPDLQAAAPLIDSVFGTTPPDRTVPFAITGLAASQGNALARALLDALALASSRAPVSAVFGLLQQPAVARRFDLDDEDLARVHRWLRDAGVHWALDEGHRSALGLPPDARCSLADGLQRLWLGHALPDACDAPFAGLLPVGSAEGSDALALGALARFAALLAALRAELAHPLAPAPWAARLHRLVDELLLPAAHEQADAAELREAIATLAERWTQAGLSLALPADVVRQALMQVLDDPARGGVPTGRVTFSALSSLRGLPYRMVCVLGLDDGVFPSAQRPAEFDLMAQAPRAGDRQRRSDERNLFLDLVLAARERLHLSYTGRSLRDNAPMPPSVLVAELLETLLPALDAPPQRARARLVVEHPLQAFDPLLFDPATDERQRSHQADYAQALAAAQAAAAAGGPRAAGAPGEAEDGGSAAGAGAPAAADGMAEASADADADATDATDATDDGDDRTGPDDDDEAGGDAGAGAAPRFFLQPLPPPPEAARRLSLADLQRFFRHPSRHLLRHRLGLWLRRPDEALVDDEPFLPDTAARRALARRLLPALQAGADEAALRALAAACSELPSGTPGRQFIDAELPLLQNHARALAARLAPPTLPPHQARIDVEVQGLRWTLELALADLRPEGLVRHRYDDARAGDYLEAWIDHLALCACAPAGVAGQTLWLGRDGPFRLHACDDALALLHTLVRLYAEGSSSPLYFFPRSAWAWRRPGGSLAQARLAWVPSARRPFAEQADAAHRLVLRGLPDPLAEGLPRFEAAARTVFDALPPLLEDPRFAGPGDAA